VWYGLELEREKPYSVRTKDVLYGLAFLLALVGVTRGTPTTTRQRNINVTEDFMVLNVRSIIMFGVRNHTSTDGPLLR
jgi:hypothetical protein